MHGWCTEGANQCVLAVLLVELRRDRQASAGVRVAKGVALATEILPSLPSLPHELWLLIMEFIPRHQLGSMRCTA